LATIQVMALVTSLARSPVDSVANWGDVVISEVMFDPEPTTDVSLGEFVELFNRSAKTFPLDGWTIHSGKKKYLIGEQGAVLPPGGYFVAGSITLPNSGTTLALYDGKGTLVHAVTYGIPFDGPEWKKEGGWSLEAPDPDEVCTISESWEYSFDPSGGTPGRINSCDGDRPDLAPPVFLYPGFGMDGELQLHFSERIESPEELYGKVALQPGNLRADSVIRDQLLGDLLTCYFPRDPSSIPGFTVRLPGMRDCSGNQGPDLSVRAGSSVQPVLGSILISEVMYDPPDGFPEFIELYHPGPGFTDLAGLTLGVAPPEGFPDRFVPLSPHSRLVAPGELVVLTVNERLLRTVYGLERSGAWHEVPELPGLPRSGGWIYLADRAGNPVDVAAYSDDMHLDLIRESKGISLERIDFERPGTESSVWHSAGSLEGYSTPGRFNSQAGEAGASTDLLLLDPKVFSPDNDGYHDLLRITVNPGEPGALVRIWITATDGSPVRELANNHISGPISYCSWNGEDTKGHMAAEGFYIVSVKVFFPSTGRGRMARGVVGIVYR